MGSGSARVEEDSVREEADVEECGEEEEVLGGEVARGGGLGERVAHCGLQHVKFVEELLRQVYVVDYDWVVVGD